MKREIGLFLAFIGIVIILSSVSGITGNLISNSSIEKPLSSILGLVFVVVGLVLFMAGKSLDKTLAQETLESGAVITNPKKLIKIAKKSGYTPGKQVKEGIPIYDEGGNYITVIPTHKISIGVYRNVIGALASGESNFRKRTDY